MKSNMRDVARRAGVSLATVSYVVNGGPRPVSNELRARVQAAMRELDYRSTRRGRARASGGLVGVIVPDASNSFFAGALSALEAVLRAQGLLTLVGSSGEDPARERELIAGVRRARCCALILTPCAGVPDEVESMADRGTPVVIMDRDGGSPRLSRVTMNNHDAAFRAVRLLIEGGHRRIALVNGPEWISTAADRLRGYREALDFAGLPHRPEYVRLAPFSFESGLQAARSLLALPEPPEAIFSSSVILTSGVLFALRERGLTWPADVAVVGYGDAVWASLLTPPLIVIEQPAQQLGETAARLCLAGLRESGAGGQRVVLDSRLVLRESHWRAGRPASAAAS